MVKNRTNKMDIFISFQHFSLFFFFGSTFLHFYVLIKTFKKKVHYAIISSTWIQAKSGPIFLLGLLHQLTKYSIPHQPNLQTPLSTKESLLLKLMSFYLSSTSTTVYKRVAQVKVELFETSKEKITKCVEHPRKYEVPRFFHG